MVQSRRQAGFHRAEVHRPLHLRNRRKQRRGREAGTRDCGRAQGSRGARLEPERHGHRLRQGRHGRVRLRRLRGVRRRGSGQQPSDQATVRGIGGCLAEFEGSAAGRHPRGHHQGVRLDGSGLWLHRSPAQAGQARRRATDQLLDPVPHFLRRKRPQHTVIARRRCDHRDPVPEAERHARLDVP